MTNITENVSAANFENYTCKIIVNLLRVPSSLTSPMDYEPGGSMLHLERFSLNCTYPNSYNDLNLFRINTESDNIWYNISNKLRLQEGFLSEILNVSQTRSPSSISGRINFSMQISQKLLHSQEKNWEIQAIPISSYLLYITITLTSFFHVSHSLMSQNSRPSCQLSQLHICFL